MNELKIVQGDLEATVSEREPGAVFITLRGTADGTVVKELDAVLAAAHARGQLDGKRVVVVDVRELEFMNSTCFKSFITWIVQVRRLPEHERYTIRFLSSTKLHWQKRSLHAFSHFGGELVEIESY